MPIIPEALNIPLIVCLFIMMDVFTGVMQAVANKDISSEKLRTGLFHKIAFICVLVLGYMLEYSMMFLDLGFDVPIVAPIAIYLVFTEAISIYENVCNIAPELKDNKLSQLLRITEMKQKTEPEEE